MASPLAFRKSGLLFVLAIVWSASVGSSVPPTGPRAGYDFQTQRLESFFRLRTQDEGALRSIYTRDAILVEADGNIVRGRNPIAHHFKKILASGAVTSFKVTTTTFRSQGTISYAGGYEDIEQHSADGPRHSRNRFIALLRREQDGMWRFDYVMEAR